jgi:hypothetical protein
MAEPTGLTDIEQQEIDSNWDEVCILARAALRLTGCRQL